MSCGYFSERKNCTEHDYAIFRTIGRFPGSEMTRNTCRANWRFFGYFLDFSPGQRYFYNCIHAPSCAAYFKVLYTKFLRLGTEIIISETSKNAKKAPVFGQKISFLN